MHGAAQIRAKTDAQWIEFFDGLRFIAAMGVVFHHANSAVAFKHWAVANFSVNLFFCLSGFLAFYILDGDKLKFGRVSYSYYLFRRVLRIWPAYFAMIAVALFVFGNSAARSQPHLGQLFGFTMNWEMGLSGSWLDMPFPHLWTIAVEEQFYLIAPLIWYALRSKYWLHFLVAVFLLTNVARTYFILYGASPFGIYYLTYTYADMFVGGAALAKAYNDGWRASLRQQYALFWLAVTWLVATAWVWSATVFPPFKWYAPIAYAVPVVGCIALLASVLPANNTPVYRLLSAGTMSYLGKVSYSIYLYHLIALMQAPVAAQAGTLVYNCIVVALCLFYAQISYILIERPVLALKENSALREFATSYHIGPVLMWGAILYGAIRFFVT